MSNNAKQAKLEPINAELKEKRGQLDVLLVLKDKMTPFHERLDPNSTFYKHYMQQQEAQKIYDLADQTAKDDRKVYGNIALRLGPKCDCNKCDKCKGVPFEQCECGRYPCTGLEFGLDGADSHLNNQMTSKNPPPLLRIS